MKFILWKIYLLCFILLSTHVLCTEATSKNGKLTTSISDKASLLLGEIPSEFANSANFNIYARNDKPSSDFFYNEENNNANEYKKDLNADTKDNTDSYNVKEKKESLNNLEENLGKKFREFRISLDLSNKQKEAKTNPIDISYQIDNYLLPDNIEDNQVKKGKKDNQKDEKEKNKNRSKILEIMDKADKKSNSTNNNTNEIRNKINNKKNYEQANNSTLSVFDSLNKNEKDNSDKIKVFEPKGKISDVDQKNNSEEIKRKVNRKNKYTHYSYPKSNGFQGFLTLLNRNEAEDADNFHAFGINRAKFALGVPSIYDFKVNNQRKSENRSNQIPKQTDFKSSSQIKQSYSNFIMKKNNNTNANHFTPNKMDKDEILKNKRANNTAKNFQAKHIKTSAFEDLNYNNLTKNIASKSDKHYINFKKYNNSTIIGNQSKQINGSVLEEGKKSIEELKQELETLKKTNKDLTKIQNEKGRKIANLKEALKKGQKEKLEFNEKLSILQTKLKSQELEMQKLRLKAEKQIDIDDLPILKNEDFRNLLKHLIAVNANNLNSQNYKCMMACGDVRLNEEQYYDFAKALKMQLGKSVFNAPKQQSEDRKPNVNDSNLKKKLNGKVIANKKKSDVDIGFIQKTDFNLSEKNNTTQNVNQTNLFLKKNTTIKNERNKAEPIDNNKLGKFEVVNKRVSLEINKLKNFIHQNSLGSKTDKMSALALEDIKISKIKINEFEKIIKKLESDKQQEIEITNKVSALNKNLMQENTSFKKQITEIYLKNEQLEKANTNLKTNNEKIKEIVKRINSEFSKNKSTLQSKLIEIYDLQEKLKKCKSQNDNYRHIVDSNLVMKDNYNQRSLRGNSDFDYSVPDDSFSTKGRFAGFSFKSIHSDIVFEKSDESPSNSLIGDIKSFLKNETKVDLEDKNIRGDNEVVNINNFKDNQNHKNSTSFHLNNPKMNRPVNDKKLKEVESSVAAKSDSKNFKNNNAIKLELNKITSKNNNKNSKINAQDLDANNKYNNYNNNINENDDFKIKRINVAKNSNKDVVEVSEENLGYKFLYKDNDLDENAKKASSQESLNEEDNDNMKHLLTHIPLNFLEINSSIKATTDKLSKINSLLEETDNISALEGDVSHLKEADVNDNLTEYKKLIAKQKQLDDYLQRTDQVQREERKSKNDLKDSENKSSEEIKAESYIQDANLKREFIQNRIKKLNDQKYLQRIEEAKSRIAKKLHKMKANEELGSEADSLINKFAVKKAEDKKTKISRGKKIFEISTNKFAENESDYDLFGLENKRFLNKKKNKINVNKGKLNLNQLSKFAKQILLDDKLSPVKDLGKNKDLNQNICWEIMYDLLWKDSHADEFEIDEDEIYRMD